MKGIASIVLAGTFMLPSQALAEGKYQITATGTGVYVWILDTETGAIRVCEPNWGAAPKCGPWTDPEE